MNVKHSPKSAYIYQADLKEIDQIDQTLIHIFNHHLRLHPVNNGCWSYEGYLNPCYDEMADLFLLECFDSDVPIKIAAAHMLEANRGHYCYQY